ncbi:MAG: hypothetical protein AMXMBFR46_27430 [Acidimicrobiia bacterium]
MTYRATAQATRRVTAPRTRPPSAGTPLVGPAEEETTGSDRAVGLRTCVGCRRRGDPSTLVRLTRRADGSLAVGPGPGRGAWLCGSPNTAVCLEAAKRRRALDRALRGPVPTDAIEELRARLGQ